MAGPRQVVSAPSVLASPTGLLQTVRPIVHGTSDDERRWEGGFSFLPNGCIGSHTVALICDENGGDTKDVDTLPAVVSYDPFVVYTGAACSSLQGVGRNDLSARMVAALETSQGVAIEDELWTGTLGTANSAPNYFLAGGSPNFENLSPLGSDVSPGFYALAALQEYLAHCAPAGRGMIHAPVNVVTMWQRFNVVRLENNLILDLYGNWIVAGSGYDGSDPDGQVDSTGETAWAYATGLVDVHLSQITLLPENGRLIDALNRRDNSVEWRAERAAAAVFDGCCHAGIRVGICETACEPSGS